MKVRAKVAYDGTDFVGFQRQAAQRGRTVQGELETALERVCRSRVTVIGAGRTDAGVHATGQVIAFEVDWKHPLDALGRALNAALPDDVAVRDLELCEADFHPRFSAKTRTYVYTAYVSAVRQPLLRRFAWQLERWPDLAVMNEAARRLIGRHDFAAFGSPPSGRAEETTVREVLRADWQCADDRLWFTIEANAFLFRMVRRVVMALVRTGWGECDPDVIEAMLESRDAQRIKGLAPACGLCLVDVKY
ncbi:MAG: tRNA pseudouridine(38-40) synthase TruA [Thermoflexales bacterium]|nr:tRNA pseudouridine(38-40) synthase TruA [Thermoflexales bacterium]MDW8351304.1 tRNA pseudouridine(38-40) synthase TruA [Anaerolineae bacterium]